MTDTKWTPGPWRWFDSGPVAPYGVYAGPDNGGRQLAYVGNFRGGTEDFANSQLMAAAPNLYEALEMAISTGMLEHGGMADTLRAVLAQARGEAGG